MDVVALADEEWARSGVARVRMELDGPCNCAVDLSAGWILASREEVSLWSSKAGEEAQFGLTAVGLLTYREQQLSPVAGDY